MYWAKPHRPNRKKPTRKRKTIVREIRLQRRKDLIEAQKKLSTQLKKTGQQISSCEKNSSKTSKLQRLLGIKTSLEQRLLEIKDALTSLSGKLK